MNGEEVPVFADRLKQVVEEFVELLSEVVPDEYDMVAQGHFVFAQLIADRLVQTWFPFCDLFQRGFNLLLQTFLEVQLVERAKGHDRMQQVG